MAAILFKPEQMLHLLPTKQDASRGWLIEPRQYTRNRCFAASALPYQCQRAARIERERGIFDSMNDISRPEQPDAPQREILTQMSRLHDRCDGRLCTVCRIRH